MSGISAIVPAERNPPAEDRPLPERDDARSRKRVRRIISQDDLVEIEPHQLDLEA